MQDDADGSKCACVDTSNLPAGAIIAGFVIVTAVGRRLVGVKLEGLVAEAVQPV